MKKRIYRTPRFIVLKWKPRPKEIHELKLSCPKCWRDAVVQCSKDAYEHIVAAIGLKLIMEPPGYRPASDFMPQRLKCPNCDSVFRRD